MATLVLGVVGAAIGGAIAPGVVAFGLTGAAIGWQAGAVLGSLFQKGPNVQGPRLGDLRVTGTDYGQPIPWVAGSPRLAGQIIWASAKREIANTQKVGKGGGQKVTSYTYEVDLAILLTDNETAGVQKIWSNGELVYGNGDVKSGVWNSINVYTGSEDQMPDPIYEAAVGAGNAPAFRGHTYVVIQGLQLGNSGQIPNLTFQVGSFLPNQYAGNASILVAAFAWRRDTDLYDKYDIANTALPTFDDYFGEFGSDAALNMTYYSTFTSGADTGVLPTKTLPIAVAHKYFLSVANGYWAGDQSFSAFEFLDAVGAVVAAIRTTSSGAIVLQHFTFIGPNLLSLTNRGSAIYTQGNIEFLSDRLRFVNSAGLTGIGDFDIMCAAQSIVAVRVSEVRVTATYTGSAQNPSNSVLLQKVPLVPEEGGSFDSYLRLSTVIERLMQRAGYNAEEYDVSALRTQGREVRGMSVSQVTSTRAVLEQLQSVYFFEASKSDKIYFFPRSLNSVASIPYEVLGTNPEPTNAENAFELVNANELELPGQLALTYPNVDSDYNNATEYSQRLDPTQDSTQAVQIPIAMTASEAKAVADGLLFDQLASMTKTSVRLPLAYAELEPGDIITVTNLDGRQYRMRVGQKNDELVVLTLDLVLDDVGALDSAAITSGDYTPTETIRQLVPTLWQAMDIPLLTDRENEPGFYVAVAPDAVAGAFDWPGAAFARSFAADNFVNEFITDARCTLGTCTTVLGDWEGPHVFDEGNSVTVLVSGELSSTTRTAMLADLSVNICLVGSEIVRFRLAEFIETVDGYNRYRLTGLLRGQRGTEQHQTGHTASERFVLLDGNLRSVLDQNGQIGAATEVKAVTLNLLLSSVTEQAFTSESVRLKPFSVANLRALADGSDLVVSWQRRTRLSYRYGGSLGDSVPLGESTELYRVRIYDGATLVRTVLVTAPTYTYTAADATADGFASSDTATIVVTQVSEIVGDGFSSEVQGIIP